MQGLSGSLGARYTLLMSALRISWRSKQSLGTVMCLKKKQSQETINTFLWEIGAIISDILTKLSKREEVRVANFPKLTFGVLRMQGLRGALGARHTLLMSASRTLRRSKLITGTAMCLVHSQDTISTFLWEIGANISDSLTKLSKREEDRIINFPKLTFGVLRKLVSSGGDIQHLENAGF